MRTDFGIEASADMEFQLRHVLRLLHTAGNPEHVEKKGCCRPL